MRNISTQCRRSIYNATHVPTMVVYQVGEYEGSCLEQVEVAQETEPGVGQLPGALRKHLHTHAAGEQAVQAQLSPMQIIYNTYHSINKQAK